MVELFPVFFDDAEALQALVVQLGQVVPLEAVPTPFLLLAQILKTVVLQKMASSCVIPQCSCLVELGQAVEKTANVGDALID